MKNLKIKAHSGRTIINFILGLVLVSILAALVTVFGLKFLGESAAQKIKSEFLNKKNFPAVEATVTPLASVSPTPAVPESVQKAQMALSENEVERKEALQALSSFSDPQPEAVQLLVKMLTSTEVARGNILPALAALQDKNPQTLQFIISSLEDPELKLVAIDTLGALGPKANEAIPALKKIAWNKKEPKMVRKKAVVSLSLISPKPKKKHGKGAHRKKKA